MKRIGCIIIVFIFLFVNLSITVFANEVNTNFHSDITILRAGGGGSSGGGGGGSSGGGVGHTTHSGSGRTPTLFETILEFVMFPIVIFSSTIVFYIKLTKWSRRSKKMMKQMMQSDSAWKFKDVSEMVNDSFYAIQTAWSDMDMTPAAQYMSAELFDSFQIKLNWMSFKNQKNILKNINLIKALPVAVYDDADNSRDYIWFYIKGRMVDYIINTETQMRESGSTSAASFEEYWQFVRRDDRWVLNQILQKNESGQIPFNE